MGEREIVSMIRRVFAARGALAEQRDDDTATMPPVAARSARVITTDLAVEGADFARGLHPWPAIGRRSLLQNLSDLAAAGATPVGFLWSLALPPSTDDALITGIAAGAADLAASAGCPLFGGDLSMIVGPLALSITAFGDVAGAPLTRTGAQVGDAVYVAGTLGGSAAGLRALRAGERAGPRTARHLEPAFDGRIGPSLVGVATACIDISDGLSVDGARLATGSGVALHIDAVETAIDREAGATLADVLGGGEDWTLLFTAPPTAVVPEGLFGSAMSAPERACGAARPPSR